MIDVFESSSRISPDAIFFTFIGNGGADIAYTYRETRIISAALARSLMGRGVKQNSFVVADLPNCPEFVFLILAAAYGGFTLVALDHGLSPSEKLTKIMELERDGSRISMQLDEDRLRQILRGVRRLPTDESDIIKNIYGGSRWSRSIMGEEQDVIDDTVHFAERAAHLFDADARAGIMFASYQKKREEQKRGKAKAVPLTWNQLIDASKVANDYFENESVDLWQGRLPFSSFEGTSGLARERTGMRGIAQSEGLNGPGSVGVRSRGEENLIQWQCALPLSHISGFQVLVRSVIGRASFRLYESFEAEAILRDGSKHEMTHISVSDEMLQDMLTIEEWRSESSPGSRSRLSDYQCILLVGRKLNPRTIERAVDIDARIFAGYGMAETSGVIAVSQITRDFRGGLKPLASYDIRIVDPDDEGFGRLAVRGPGVFSGYLNSNTAFTVDRFFITEDKAGLFNGRIYIKSRAENMFYCEGKTIYPAEIADVVRHVPGISAVHVFGVPDERRGKLPVAVVERSDPALTAEAVEHTIRHWFSNIGGTLGIYVFDQLPRDIYGKLDRQLIEDAFFHRV